MKRIFIAIKVESGPQLSYMISYFKTGLKGENIKWINNENIHVTLLFLGDTNEDKIGTVREILIKKCEGTGRFDMIIRGSGIFSKRGDPRILWAGIEPSEKLNQLYDSLLSGFKEAGFKIENHSFRPHLSFARIKSLKDMSLLKKLIDRHKDEQFQTVSVKEVILFESILEPSGPIYKPLSIINL